MKNQIFAILFFLLASKFVSGQIYLGADASFSKPFGHLKTQVDFGYGPAFILGYSVNEKIDFSFCYEIMDFKTMQPDFKIMSETFSAKYKFKEKKYNPYLGLKAGIYHSKVEIPSFINEQSMGTLKKKESAFGIAPMVGLIINTDFSKNIKFDISTAYSILFFENNYQNLGIRFGVIYVF